MVEWKEGCGEFEILGLFFLILLICKLFYYVKIVEVKLLRFFKKKVL